MAADGRDAVSLRQKPNKKSRGSIFSMSRRRISCKDLGHADCQGWLYKKKEKGAFLGNKWKKFWSVLKESALYWYTSQMAETAEGFINLPDFTVDRAPECKKKHALKISHPQIKTFYFAAENPEEMNKWLNKLGIAVINRPSLEKNEDECWSESDQDEPEISAETLPLSSLHQLAQQLPSSSTLSSEASCSTSSLDSLRPGSSTSTLCRVGDWESQLCHDTVNSSAADESGHSIALTAQAREGLPIPFSEKIIACQLLKSDCTSHNSASSVATPSQNGSMGKLQGTEGPAAQVTLVQGDYIKWFCCMRFPCIPVELSCNCATYEQNKNPGDDEMQRLFKSLEQASLSPIGDRRPSTKRELRKSFIKRSKNPSVNEKLHKIRTLNSTLKCKEHDLAMINQLLEDHKLTAKKYREWKDTNTMLFQDIYLPHDLQDCFQGNSTAATDPQPHPQTEIDT